ncbi:hypothetical protein SEUCBS140593_007296 [Sporothrix eucalyptigena]|uniref:Uncharacterized protein n=1 Tax=Sporothrix eucalyptigena TaxID=1812306 RepID=A0ABP0CD77_9PEZI
MYFTKALAAVVLAATSVAALVSPDIQHFARDVEAEIYERDAAAMGFARREDHPNPDMVAREVEDNVRRYVTVLMSRIHVDCHTLLDSCTSHSQCQLKSAECHGGHNHKCQEDREYSPSPPSSPGHGHGGHSR